ncbi:MAG: hypothetical protein KAX44_01075 [Candidatus Brocadiae bacterium]|nr:hypothetical protein [Candidatus Brocadiia bacterium]
MASLQLLAEVVAGFFVFCVRTYTASAAAPRLVPPAAHARSQEKQAVEKLKGAGLSPWPT